MPRGKKEQGTPATVFENKLGFETTDFILMSQIQKNVHDFFLEVARQIQPERRRVRVSSTYKQHVLFDGEPVSSDQIILENDELEKLTITFSLPQNISRNVIIEAAAARGVTISRDDIKELSRHVTSDNEPMRDFSIAYTKLFTEKLMGKSDSKGRS